jgi:hypothetical protein
MSVPTEPGSSPVEAEQPLPDAPSPVDARQTLETIDDLAPLEIIGGAIETPPETDQMRLF